MRSMRARLATGLGAGLATVLFVFGLVFYLYFRYVIQLGFDETLYRKAWLFAGSVENKGSAGLEFEMRGLQDSDYSRRMDDDFVEIWDESGTRIYRSPVLGASDLCKSSTIPENPRYSDMTLPGGQIGRLVAFTFIPNIDEDDVANENEIKPAGSNAARQLRIALAAPRGGLDASLRRILGGLIIGGLLLLACVVTTVWLTVRVGLRPLNRIAVETSLIDARNLSHRFDVFGLPPELTPIAERLNDLMKRMQASIDRERRFTADAAHELRTPVAELRTLSEVGLRETENEHPSIRVFLSDARAIALHLEGLINALLTLARVESRSERADRKVIDLAENVTTTVADMGRRRPDIKLETAIPSTARVLADSTLVRVMLDNMFDNVAEHTTQNGAVLVSLQFCEAAWHLKIKNSAVGLTAKDLSHVFDPFWCKSADRGGSSHFGLGLALVAECAQLMEVRLRASIEGGNMFVIDAEWHAAKVGQEADGRQTNPATTVR